MSGLLRMEYRKLVTTRSWWVLLAAMAAYMVFIGAVMAFALTVDGSSSVTTNTPVNLDPVATVTMIYTLAASLGYVFPLLVGALSVTAEFRHRTLTPTLLAEPDRSRVILAKLAASIPLGLLFGVVGALATTGAGAAVLAITGNPTELGNPEVLGVIARTALALTVWCVVGVGLGCALPNQVVTIVVALAFTQFIEPLARTALSALNGGDTVASYLPGAAGEAISGGSAYSSLGIGGMLPAWAGALVLIGYAVVFAVIGRLTSFRKDIT